MDEDIDRLAFSVIGLLAAHAPDCVSWERGGRDGEKAGRPDAPVLLAGAEVPAARLTRARLCDREDHLPAAQD